MSLRGFKMSDLNNLLLLEMTHDPVGPAEVQIQAITCALQEMHDVQDCQSFQYINNKGITKVMIDSFWWCKTNNASDMT